jgi:hypothetical protein
MATIIAFPTGRSASNTCAYCGSPITRPAFAARKVYCNGLCAAFHLILTTYEQDSVDIDVFADILLAGIERLLSEDERPMPVRVRDSDVDQAFARLPGNTLVVPIADDGVADWVPFPTSPAA